jgi:hypothetical protein
MTFDSGRVKRSGARLAVPNSRAGAPGKEKADNAGVTFPARLFESGAACGVDGVHVRPAREQQLDDVLIPAIRGQVKRRGPVVMWSFDVRAAVQQQACGIHMIGNDRVVEWRRARLGMTRVAVGSMREKQINHFGIAAPGGIVKRCAPEVVPLVNGRSGGKERLQSADVARPGCCVYLAGP